MRPPSRLLRPALLLLLLGARPAADLGAQLPDLPHVWAELGVDRSSTDLGRRSGMSVGLRVRLPLRRFSLAFDYTRFPSQHEEAPFELLSGEPATVVTDGTDHLMSVGLQGTLVQWSRRSVALSLRPGAGVSLRQARSSVAIIDSSGALVRRDRYDSDLYGPRFEVAVNADVCLGEVRIGIAAGPSVSFGVGAGDGRTAVSALRTWFLRGRVGF